MTAATRKASERARRKADGQVEYKGWLSASDHAALTQMARDSGMTQGQVVSRLIGIPQRLVGLERFKPDYHAASGWVGMTPDVLGRWIIHSDLTAAIGLNTAKAGDEGEG